MSIQNINKKCSIIIRLSFIIIIVVDVNIYNKNNNKIIQILVTQLDSNFLFYFYFSFEKKVSETNTTTNITKRIDQKKFLFSGIKVACYKHNYSLWSVYFFLKRKK